MNTNSNDAVIVLSRALDQTGDLVAGVREEQWSDPTPCSEWDVAALVNHLVADVNNFVTMVRGEQPDWSATPSPVEGDAAVAFRAAGDDLIHACHQAGEGLDSTPVNMGIAEFAVHGWDLARATGQTRPLDPEVAERGLAFMRSNLTPENRGDAFGEATTVDADEGAYAVLAGFAGRDPAQFG